MLCRKAGETICIGDDVEVTVTRTDRGRVYLGIAAPRHLIIDRKEIRQKPDYDARQRTPAGEQS